MQIARRATTDLGEVVSVHIRGVVHDHNKRLRVNVRLLRGEGCVGTFAESGQGEVGVIMIAKTFWLKPDDKFWRSIGASPTAVRLLSGKYLTLSTKSRFRKLARLCRLAAWVKVIRKDLKAPPLVRAQRTRLSGGLALKLTGTRRAGTFYVSIARKPELLRIGGGGSKAGGSLSFTEYGGVVTLRRPPYHRTVNARRFGM